MSKGTVAIDFAGTLCDFHGWQDAEPVAGAAAFVFRVIEAGYTPVIYSTMPADIIAAWLTRRGFPALGICSEKPEALVYIDDRGFRFEGDWDAAFAAITREPTLAPRAPAYFGGVGPRP